MNRRYLFFAGSIYLAWWFAVELLLPGSFNPFLSRLVVVALIFVILASSYFSVWVQRHLQTLFAACLWLMTAHYYYLFYGNQGDVNWIAGSFITVIAITFCLLSNGALLSYSIYVVVLSLGMDFLLPALESSLFLPGLITILIQANIGLRTRLKVLKTLRDSNERFQLLFNSTFEGVLVHENKEVIDVNQSLLKMLGYSRSELLGKDVMEILAPNERALGEEKLKFEDVPPFETKALTRGGQFVDIELRAKNFQYDKRTVRLVTVQTLTDRKRAEKERIYAMTLAENVRIRDEFISIASHELKTPLSALKLQTQMIERDLQKNKDEAYPAAKMHEMASTFDRQINRLTELIETMLDVSRISSDRLTLDLAQFDFVALIMEVSRTLQNQNSSAQDLFKFDLPESLSISADRVRIKQAVLSLFSNALKYGEGKQVRVRLQHVSSQAVLVVEDHGLGIAPEFIGRIFDRFERAISAKNISGFGLGLYIARKIIEQHGGRISVESIPNVGTTFTVRLPLSR